MWQMPTSVMQTNMFFNVHFTYMYITNYFFNTHRLTTGIFSYKNDSFALDRKKLYVRTVS